MTTAVIVPVYLGSRPSIDKPEVERHMGKLAACMGQSDTLYLMEDGKLARLGFVGQPGGGLVHQEFFGDHRGCTRGWEMGAQQAYRDGHDVLIFSNQDSHPATTGDFEAYSQAIREHQEYFALGPVTDEAGAGHGPDEQKVLKASPGLTKVRHLNGFTFGVHRSAYARVCLEREQGTFFLMEPLMRFSWAEKKTVPCDKYENSLMWVGQEDELFDFATGRLEQSLAVCGDCFWRHDKWELTRKTEVEQ